jgi:hypothetical protein
MKKLVALAVAGAFVAPVYAADISLSGATEFSLVNAKTTATTKESLASDTSFSIKASTETNSGLKVAADINMDAGGGTDGGNSIDISGPFGKLVLGSDAGAMDSIDGRGDVFKVVDHDMISGSRMNFSDAAITYTLPSMIPNLTAKVAYSPEDGETGVNAGESTADQSGFVVTYKAGPVLLGVATQEVGAESDQGFSAVYAASGLKVSYEAMQNETEVGVKTNYNSMGVSYAMGDLTFAYTNTSEKQSGGNDLGDTTAYGIHYNLGGGVLAFFEVASEDIVSSKDDTSALGVEFKF